MRCAATEFGTTVPLLPSIQTSCGAKGTNFGCEHLDAKKNLDSGSDNRTEAKFSHSDTIVYQIVTLFLPSSIVAAA